MVRHDMPGAVEPECGDLCQHLPFVGNAGAKDVIERGNAIGCDDQQAVAEIVDVSDLAAPIRLATVERGGEEWRGVRHAGCPRPWESSASYRSGDRLTTTRC